MTDVNIHDIKSCLFDYEQNLQFFNYSSSLSPNLLNMLTIGLVHYNKKTAYPLNNKS